MKARPGNMKSKLRNVRLKSARLEKVRLKLENIKVMLESMRLRNVRARLRNVRVRVKNVRLKNVKARLKNARKKLRNMKPHKFFLETNKTRYMQLYLPSFCNNQAQNSTKTEHQLLRQHICSLKIINLENAFSKNSFC